MDLIWEYTTRVVKQLIDKVNIPKQNIGKSENRTILLESTVVPHSTKDVDLLLNSMGSEGWELISVQLENKYSRDDPNQVLFRAYVLIFKRFKL